MAPRRFNHQLTEKLKCTQDIGKINGVVVKVWQGLSWADGVSPEESVPF